MTSVASSRAGVSRITEAEFTRFCDYFYKRTGIHFTAGKRYFVDKRLETCIRASGEGTFASWFAALRLGIRPELLEQAINELTVNETYFMREDYQFDSLVRHVLPAVLAERRRTHAPEAPVRILSLPCSTGEEPYSIALRLIEEWPQLATVDVEIHAGDIDSGVLHQAREGVYGARSVQRVPQVWLDRHFTTLPGGRWRIADEIRSVVSFTQINLCDTDQMRRFANFDVAFCRNALIYFDELSGRRAAEHLYATLRPGGYLFLGHSESMSRFSSSFEPRRQPEGLVYQRSTGAPA